MPTPSATSRSGATARSIGWVTSGGYGHCVGKSLAMGYIEKAHADAEAGFEIEIIGERRPAVRLAAPAYDPAGAAMRSLTGRSVRAVARASSYGRLVGDLLDVGAVDAEIVQFAIRIGGEFAHDAPIDLPRAEKSRDERKVHESPFLGADPFRPPQAGPAEK